MNTKDFERILREMGFQLVRSNDHKIWSNGQKNVAVPHQKEINKMIARRTLKELSYQGSVPQINYFK